MTDLQFKDKSDKDAYQSFYKRESDSMKRLRSEIKEAYQRFYRREKGLNNYEKVVVRDLSNFVSGKSNNGGCYAFFTRYEWNEDSQKYRVSHDTSAEFQFCDGCGRFSDCNCDYSYITEEKLEEVIKRFADKDKIEVEIERSGQ